MANPGRYVVFMPKVVAACMEWARQCQWPDGSFVTLATGLWGRYHGR